MTEKTLGLTDQTLESIDEQELDIETILPYGGMILSVVSGSQLSKTDLKRMLAQRGIFLTSSEKERKRQIAHTFLPDVGLGKLVLRLWRLASQRQR